jgi:hypothetical protein
MSIDKAALFLQARYVPMRDGAGNLKLDIRSLTDTRQCKKVRHAEVELPIVVT